MSFMLLLHASEINSELETNQWLALALDEMGGRPMLETTHGGIASDGRRIHISEDAEYTESEGSQKFFQVIESLGVRAAKPIFVLNKRFLLDAIAGMEGNEIVFCNSGANLDPVLISSSKGQRVAIVGSIDKAGLKAPTLPRRDKKTDETQGEYKP